MYPAVRRGSGRPVANILSGGSWEVHRETLLNLCVAIIRPGLENDSLLPFKESSRRDGDALPAVSPAPSIVMPHCYRIECEDSAKIDCNVKTLFTAVDVPVRALSPLLCVVVAIYQHRSVDIVVAANVEAWPNKDRDAWKLCDVHHRTDRSGY
jgi:hypothetical protein